MCIIVNSGEFLRHLALEANHSGFHFASSFVPLKLITSFPHGYAVVMSWKFWRKGIVTVNRMLVLFFERTELLFVLTIDSDQRTRTCNLRMVAWLRHMAGIDLV